MEGAPARSEQTDAGRTVLLVNTRARSGQAALPSVTAALRSAGVEVDEALALRPKGIRGQLTQLLSQGFGRFIVGGGDGTLSCAADVLAGRDVVMGILPLGTGNDFARSLGVPLTLPEACAVIAAGHERRVDLGCVNGRFFLNAVSLGITAKMAEALDTDLKRKAGVFAYTLAALSAFRRHRPFRVALQTAEGSYDLRVLQLVVGNGKYHGAGRIIAPKASLEDHALDVYAVKADWDRAEKRRSALGHAWVLAKVAAELRSGRHVEDADVLHLRTREVHVQAIPRQTVNVDGELGGKSPLQVSVVPGALRVFAPSPAPRPVADADTQ